MQFHVWIIIQHIYNLPLTHVRDVSDVDHLVQLVKKVFSEYVGYSYQHAPASFNNCFNIHYSIKYGNITCNWKKLKNKHFSELIKLFWFTVVNNPVISGKRLGRFRLDNACRYSDSHNVRVPYTYSDLLDIKTNMPIVYQCLENNDELWSSIFDTKS